MQEAVSGSGRTVEVPASVFREVYDSPASLPGRERWTTIDEDVRAIERLLGLDHGAIGAPLWVSGDSRHCPTCEREVNWLDIVSSALRGIHSRATVARVILGDRKYVNTEAPATIANVACAGCGAGIDGLRSFKCHNWAYAIGELEQVIARLDNPPA